MLFSDWLRGHARGELDAKIGEALAEVSGSVLELDRAGKVTITLTVTANRRLVAVVGTVTAKAPNADGEASLWFIGPDGQLAKDDPYFGHLPGTEPSLLDADHDAAAD